jgi:hypothetical protein
MNKDWLNDLYVQKWLGKKTKKTEKLRFVFSLMA